MEWNQSLQGQRSALAWFTESQLQSVIMNGVIPEWFHGIISRKTAEELLLSKPPGYFLIRVSESRIGYTLSYRAEDRCRHFMIDALDDGHYIILGETKRHRFLQDLVDFHRRNPIMPFTEVLTVACGQISNDQTDYAELLFPQRMNHNSGLLPNNTWLPNASHPTSPKDIPPALPYRPNDLVNPAALYPSQTNRLYPSLEEYPHIPSPLPAPPLPVARKCHKADSPAQPPEVPTRSSTVTINNQPGKNREAKPEKTEAKEQPHPEYQESTEERRFSSTYNDGRLTNGEVPHEYLQPPPFAPGY
ncbi:uncharacterized protein V6R79_010046 [Siganus canaliculatus]